MKQGLGSRCVWALPWGDFTLSLIAQAWPAPEPPTVPAAHQLDLLELRWGCMWGSLPCPWALSQTHSRGSPQGGREKNS